MYTTVYPDAPLRDLSVNCTLCLGAMQAKHETLLALFNAAANEQHLVGMTTFAVSTTIPPACLIRRAVIIEEVQAYVEASVEIFLSFILLLDA